MESVPGVTSTMLETDYVSCCRVSTTSMRRAMLLACKVLIYFMLFALLSTVITIGTELFSIGFRGFLYCDNSAS